MNYKLINLRNILLFVILIIASVGNSFSQIYKPWKKADGPLVTRWTAGVNPGKLLPEYPRPQMVRKNWENLNGLWEYAIVGKRDAQPVSFQGQILVPFPLESALSGVKMELDTSKCLWYRKNLQVPKSWQKEKVLLHFGAIDWESAIIVNNKLLVTHKGGYDPFTVDITDAIDRNKTNQEILVKVTDPSEKLPVAHGKQVFKPSGIWYTSVTGIWQTVWLESVPKQYITGLKMTPEIDEGNLFLEVQTNDNLPNYAFEAKIFESGRQIATIAGISGQTIKIPVKNPKLWSPTSPFLYDIKVQLKKGNQIKDEVASYFGMREIEQAKDHNGVKRIMLNHEPIFQYGLLDQGYWPDGLYTAPTEEALRYDIELTKLLGFNMIRKHVKVEPDRWYYLCDKMGVLVWQDMPNVDTETPRNDFQKHTKASSEQFEKELKLMIDNKYNHPCILTWILFNEGMGQYDTKRLAKWINDYDTTRTVNATSGWNDKAAGDIHDAHIYPGPGSPEPENERVAVLGEFGGLGMAVSKHLWQERDNWGYANFKNASDLTQAYKNLLVNLRSLVEYPGLSAAIYTQTTDIEQEINGLITYDRDSVKIIPALIADVTNNLYKPLPKIKSTSIVIGEKAIWKYTVSVPAENWNTVLFNDSVWLNGAGGFGVSGSERSVSKSPWETKELWMRHTFNLDEKLQNPYLRISYKSKFAVFINGEKIEECQGQSNGYYYFAFDGKEKESLKPGTNIIAVKVDRSESNCQYIDVQLVDVEKIKN